jgi:hypothetical protein
MRTRTVGSWGAATDGHTEQAAEDNSHGESKANDALARDRPHRARAPRSRAAIRIGCDGTG